MSPYEDRTSSPSLDIRNEGVCMQVTWVKSAIQMHLGLCKGVGGFALFSCNGHKDLISMPALLIISVEKS